MDSKILAELVDQQRWLLNNGLIPDSAKNQLFVYGSLVHKDIKAIELAIDPNSKLLKYDLYADKELIGKIEKYHKLSKSTSFWGLWRFKRMLEKEGNLNFKTVLSNFVTDFLGPKWRTEVSVLDYATYTESEQSGNKPDSPTDK